MGAERDRLQEADAAAAADPNVTPPWRQWGPFVSEREWGTVREDYSADGEAWGFLSHDAARSTAYRWGEDGLAGVCDRRQGVCLGLALWNGQDPILKERLFGLTGKEGNHGEDVKECYWYTDATPTHSWMSWRYHYPQAAFPYEDLIEENARRGYEDPEYELIDTGVFDHGYWIVEVDYAKASPSDLCMRIRATNHGPAPATLHVLPTVWLRNTWAWGKVSDRPELRGHAHEEGHAVVVDHPRLGRWVVAASPGAGDATDPAAPEADGELLFCENETNTQRRYGTPNPLPYPKDAINDHVVSGGTADPPLVNPEHTGTKAAWWFRRTAAPGETIELHVRMRRAGDAPAAPQIVPVVPIPLPEAEPTVPEAPLTAADIPPLGDALMTVMHTRQQEADELYAELTPPTASTDEAMILRRAYAGLLWSQQFFRFDVARWLDGDPAGPPPPASRATVRNEHWRHLDANDVIVMPDKWEYPWFASWDLAFHATALAHLDPQMAKDQLELLFKVWYQHPNGALPAYEWEFSDANPPVHAWAALHVYRTDASMTGRFDDGFLERIFHKLLLNFTWWVNREDAEGNNVFEGGFLGLDNIGPFNRSEGLPFEGTLEQSDGTGWMAMYCLNLLEIALTLAARNPVYEDVAVKFFEHFTFISEAMMKTGLWSEEDGFFFDVVRLDDGTVVPVKIRSMVGLVPMTALTVIEDHQVANLSTFLDRARWFVQHKPTADSFFGRYVPDEGRAMGLLSVVSPDRLRHILQTVLAEDELLSPYGLRSMSRAHRDTPVSIDISGTHTEVRYEPAESASGLFGGNSNWRGPIWFPLNFLVIEKLRRYHEFVGDDFTVELPTGSGRHCTLHEVAQELSARLVSIFTRGADGDRPVFGTERLLQDDPAWRDQPWFFEYFDGDTGAGLGASHQTGWTALVANLILSGHPPIAPD